MTDELVLELERLVPALPYDVFRAFTTADELAVWWGPQGFTTPSLDFEPRVGGTYRIRMQPPDGDAFPLTGEFTEVEPPKRLAFTFAWEDPDPDDVATLAGLTFRGQGEATEVLLRQGRFRTEARRELHRDGWSDTLDKLSAWLTRR
ncbi:MAG: SRPBCC domain-containing protein [Thermoleophilaceae bacterium]